MKTKTIIAGLLTLMIFSFATAQPPGGDRPNGERVQAMKVGMITQRRNLTPAEAEKFWPVYNQYEADMDAIKKDRREELFMAKSEFATMSDAEVQQMVNDLIQLEQRRSELIIQYNAEFQRVLPIRKVAMLYRTEREFRQKIIDEIRARQQGNGRGGPRLDH
jgi:Spy/CpxP family protein refolding chaperone